MIYLDGSVFGTAPNIESIALAPNNFVSNTAGIATTEDHHVIYDKDDGLLYYDTNGSGAGESVLIATFSNKPPLSASDIYVV